VRRFTVYECQGARGVSCVLVCDLCQAQAAAGSAAVRLGESVADAAGNAKVAAEQRLLECGGGYHGVAAVLACGKCFAV
jgi:hypothetical protein